MKPREVFGTGLFWGALVAWLACGADDALGAWMVLAAGVLMLGATA